MPKDTPSMAKNKIKRSLTAICDPHPTKKQVDELWEYFSSSCAYCGLFINKKSRTGHIDHLIPAAEGGSNNIYNHALACSKCNGDEKRDEFWLSFLEKKSNNQLIFKQRKQKIDNWIALSPLISINNAMTEEADKIIREAINNFEISVEKMRLLRTKL